MKRPLLFLLGVWIMGEWAVKLAGVPLCPATPLDAWMAGRETAEVRVIGTVRQIRRTRTGVSYILGNAAAGANGEYYRTRSVLVFSSDAAGLSIGMTAEAAGSLSPFPVPGNPGEFDLRGYYRSLGIDWRLFEDSREIRSARTDLFRQRLYLLRERLSEELERLAGPDESAVMEAMLLGDRSGLSPELKKDYRDASLSHLLAISGLHISLLGMGLFRLLRKRAFPIPLQYSLSSLLIVSYTVMTGASASSVRAAVMFLLYLGARMTGRSYDALSAMSAAGLLLLASYPLLLFQSSFQLSFLAVFGVAGLWPLLSGWLGDLPPFCARLGLMLAVQWAIWPVTAVMNGMVPVLGLWVNLAVLPLAGPLLVSAGAGAGAGALRLPAASWLIRPAKWILKWISFLTEAVRLLPGQNLVTGCPEPWQIGVYGLLLTGVVLLMRRSLLQEHEKRKRKKRGALRFLLILIISACLPFSLKRLPVRGVQIMCIDVGQGDCILVRSASGSFLIDAGSSQVEDVSGMRVLPCLRSLGISRLDGLLLTHSDRDHISGIPALLEDGNLRVDTLLLTEAEAETPEIGAIRKLAERRRTDVRMVKRGDIWQWGSLNCSCLYPGEEETMVFADDPNETSAVLLLEAEGIRALFTGDLGEEGEKRLLETGVSLQAELLKVGHHGSRFSSSESFLQAVQPELALISAGKNNLYGHPSPDTLKRLQEAQCRFLCTADGGALTVLAENGSWQAYRYKAPEP